MFCGGSIAEGEKNRLPWKGNWPGRAFLTATYPTFPGKWPHRLWGLYEPGRIREEERGCPGLSSEDDGHFQAVRDLCFHQESFGAQTDSLRQGQTKGDAAGFHQRQLSLLHWERGRD